MSLRIKKAVCDEYIPIVWDYMRSRYPPSLLHMDGMLNSEIKGLAQLLAQCAAYHKPLTFERIDMVRYAQDYLEFRGQGCLYRIYLLMYDREGWKEYKSKAKGSDRRTMIAEQEKKFNDFLEKEKKRNGKNK